MGFPDIITFILIIGLIISATVLLKFILISMFNIASSDKLMTAILAVIAFFNNISRYCRISTIIYVFHRANIKNKTIKEKKIC